MPGMWKRIRAARGRLVATRLSQVWQPENHKVAVDRLDALARWLAGRATPIVGWFVRLQLRLPPAQLEAVLSQRPGGRGRSLASPQQAMIWGLAVARPQPPNRIGNTESTLGETECTGCR